MGMMINRRRAYGGSNLPAGYRLVEWIGNNPKDSGDWNIHTSILPVDLNWRFEGTIMFAQALKRNYQIIFVSGLNDSYNRWRIRANIINDNYFIFNNGNAGSTKSISLQSYLNKKTDFILDKNHIEMRGIRVDNSTSSANNWSESILSISSWAQWYAFRAYHNDVLVANYIPCIDSNNTACFYDTITKTILRDEYGTWLHGSLI